MYHWVGLLFEFNESNQLLRAEHIDSIAGGTLPTTYQAQLSASYEGRKLQHRSDLILQDDYTSCGACMIENLFLSAKREARPKTIKMSSIRSGHLAALERYPNEPGISDALRSSRAEFLSKFNARQLSNTPSPSFDNHQASSSVLISLTAQKDRAEIAEREATEAVARALAATTPLRTAESAAAKQVIEARLSVVAAKAVVASLKTVLDEGIAAQSEFLACHREKLEIRITQKRLEGEAAAEELAAQKAKKRADKKDASPADRSLAEQAAARASHAVTLAAEVKATGDALKVKKAALKNKAAVASAEAGAVRSKYTAAKATETAAEANEAAIVAISQQASQMLLAATLQVSKAQKTLSTAKLLTTTLTASLAETTHEHYLRKTILKSSLPTLQVAAELLGGLIPSFIKPRQTNKPLVLVDVLPDATSPFTPFHKQIYDLFLVRNRGMYTRPNWTSWFWIAKANMEPFRLLYKKVNTLLCHIYPSKGEILVSVVQGIDLQLVDHLLEKAMAYYHEHFYKDQTVAFCSKDRDKSYFSIVDDGGESLSLTLSKEFLPFANSSLSKAYEETSTERAQLAAERDTLRADLSTRDATIAKLSSAVATKDATIAEQVATIAELRSTGLMKDTTIAEQGAMIAKLSSAVATKDATIARLSSAVATKDAEIAGFGGECTRLREERLAMSASIDQIALAVRQKDDEIARLRRELEIARRHSGTPGFFPPTPAASEASTAAPGTSASRVV